MAQTNPHPENPLSSTDSPETYYTGSGTPVEPDELDEIIKRLDTEIQDATNRQQHIRFAPTYKHAARKALLAWRKQAVDAAVAANLEKCLSIIDVSDMLHYMYAELEQLKKKEA